MVIINHSELLSLFMEYPSTATQPGSGQMLVAFAVVSLQTIRCQLLKLTFLLDEKKKKKSQLGRGVISIFFVQLEPNCFTFLSEKKNPRFFLEKRTAEKIERGK